MMAKLHYLKEKDLFVYAVPTSQTLEDDIKGRIRKNFNNQGISNLIIVEGEFCNASTSDIKSSEEYWLAKYEIEKTISQAYFMGEPYLTNKKTVVEASKFSSRLSKEEVVNTLIGKGMTKLIELSIERGFL